MFVSVLFMFVSNLESSYHESCNDGFSSWISPLVTLKPTFSYLSQRVVYSSLDIVLLYPYESVKSYVN